MSKRKSASATKHSRRQKIATKAHGAAQAVVRSPKEGRLCSGATKTPRHKNSNQTASGVESSLTALQDDCKPTTTAAPSPERFTDFDQPAPVIESLETASRGDPKHIITDNNSKRGLDLSSAAASLQTSQAKWLEMAQANMQFGFQLAQSLATIRSPVDFPSVIPDLTSKRIAVFQKNSKEMLEMSMAKKWWLRGS